jgi:hypothetical protein
MIVMAEAVSAWLIFTGAPLLSRERDRIVTEAPAVTTEVPVMPA